MRLVRTLAALGLLCFTPPVLARAPEVVQVRASANCPAAADVVEELGPLLPRSRVSVAPETEASGATLVQVADEGDSVRIRVAGQERSFRDADRSCRERARNAAVFIGLVLDPPVLPEPEPPAPPPAPPPVVETPPPPPAKPKPSPPVVDEPGPPLTLQLGPLLQAAPGSDARQVPVAGGFGARIGWGEPWGVAFGAAFILPTRLALPAADARLVWLPFDVSLRAAYETGPVLIGGELGPELALLFASGDRVKNPRTSTRVEVGARAAVSLTWGMSRHLGAFATLFGVVRPSPYDFKVNPDIQSGSTPPLWLGASLGLSFRTR